MTRAFWATLIGGVVGGGAGIYVGGLAGWTVFPAVGVGVDEEFGDFYTIFAAAGLGAWLGCVLGAYIALRIANVARAGETAARLAVVAPIVVGAATWLSVSLTDADDFGSNFLPHLIFTLSVIAAAYIAARLGSRRTFG